MKAGRRGVRRWFASTSNRTFLVYPLAVAAFEWLRHGGGLAIEPWALPLLAWGYLQYRLAGRYRTAHGGGGPGLAVPPERLVTEGPYGVVRNPMYLGHLVFLAGLALVFRSWAAALLLLVHLHWFDARAKEDEVRLRARFGAAYDTYAARVKRWLPGIL